MNARQLVTEYGHVCKAPAGITGTILATAQYVMCADLRERYRHLAHLPMGTTFTFVEMQLDRHLLSATTVDKFAAEFSRRARERANRARQETRRAERAEKWSKHMMLVASPTDTPRLVDRDCSPPPFVMPTLVRSAAAELQAAWSTQADDAYPSLARSVSIAVTPQAAVDSSASMFGQSPPSFAEVSCD